MLLDLFKKQIYAGLHEILIDKKYFYESIVGDNYSKLTEEGEQALIEYINMVGPQMLKKHVEELESMAKSMTWNELKR